MSPDTFISYVINIYMFLVMNYYSCRGKNELSFLESFSRVAMLRLFITIIIIIIIILFFYKIFFVFFFPLFTSRAVMSYTRREDSSNKTNAIQISIFLIFIVCLLHTLFVQSLINRIYMVDHSARHISSIIVETDSSQHFLF